MGFTLETPLEHYTGNQNHINASVIWLHGLGADGNDFAGILPELSHSLPTDIGIRFIFPHAPMQAVTINQGYVMRSWYDIIDTGFTRQEDEAGIRASSEQIEALIQTEIDKGIDPSRIFLAGFSQGGAIVLHTGLRLATPIGGIIALSTYLPLAHTVDKERHRANLNTPILMAHGEADDVVPIAMAEISQQQLIEQGYHIDWHRFPIAHSVNIDEIAVIGQWLNKRLNS